MCRLGLCFIFGKKNRRVPVLLLPEVKEGMKCLLETRSCQNQYVRESQYLLCDQTGKRIDGGRALKQLATESGVDKPHLFSSR